MKTVLTLALLATVAVGPAMAREQNMQRQGAMGGPQQSSQSMDQNTIRNVQQQLQQQGYDVGQIDGVMGPNTRQALSQFQRDNNMPASGRLDQQTMAALGVQEGAPQQAQTPEEGRMGSPMPRSDDMNPPENDMQQQQPGGMSR
ncbi:MAG: peptidoglycan-binding protein [Magnetospirillum sp.]|nr:peptidoglycan-binding protein [Magnetospirillum sp.]